MYSVDFVTYPHPFFSFLALFLSLLCHLSSIRPSIHPSIHACWIAHAHAQYVTIHICVCFLGGQFGIAQPEFLHSSWGRLLLPSSPSLSCLRLRTPKLFHFHFSTPISVFLFCHAWAVMMGGLRGHCASDIYRRHDIIPNFLFVLPFIFIHFPFCNDPQP